MNLNKLSDLNFVSAFYSVDIDKTHDTAVKLINAVAQKNGGTCYIGKYWSKNNGLQKYITGNPLKNFCCDFVLPEYSANIDRILKENSAEIYNLASMVIDAGGYLVFWQ